MKSLILVFICSFLIISCSQKKDPDNAEFFYKKAIKNIEKANYISAKENLEKIGDDYPYSNVSSKAEILIAFIEFVQKNYDEAIIASDKFIKLRPANQYVNYMYFLKAESYYKNRSDYLREQNTSAISKDLFQQMIARFRNSKYKEISEQRIKQVNEEIAAYHLDIARTHLLRTEYIPAIKRLQMVTEKYPETFLVPEAKYRLAESFLAMGLKEQALFEYKDLKEKYPKNSFTKLGFPKITKKFNVQKIKK
jgi:outer membrane protein assembly factor BamD